MKGIIKISLVLLVLAGAFAGWKLFGSNTAFDENKKSLFIKTGSTINDVIASITDNDILHNPGIFKFVAARVGYDKNIIPGKYVIPKGSSIYTILKTLKAGRQSPVDLIITKLRTKEDLARKLAANFEADSIAFINLLGNVDSLAVYGLDSNTVMTAIIPNTYNIFWNTTPSRIFKKLYAEQQRFWTPERKKKADALNLSPAQVYTLASIVEEETNMQADKGNIASVYLNRLAAGMKLGADPTVKFAMKDFGLKRIYNKHLSFPSPYNTYQNTGLPPGPICTPSINTIDAVLNAPTTSYLYFVAKPDLNGYSNFAVTYEEHMRYAKAYQQALDSIQKAKEAR